MVGSGGEIWWSWVVGAKVATWVSRAIGVGGAGGGARQGVGTSDVVGDGGWYCERWR